MTKSKIEKAIGVASALGGDFGFYEYDAAGDLVDRHEFRTMAIAKKALAAMLAGPGRRSFSPTRSFNSRH